MTSIVDKVLHGEGDRQDEAQAAAQEAAFNDAEMAAFGGASPKAEVAPSAGQPSGM